MKMTKQLSTALALCLGSFAAWAADTNILTWSWLGSTLEANVTQFPTNVIALAGSAYYRLEHKDSLSDSNWVAHPLVAGTGGTVTFTDTTATGSQRFYRVRRW